MPSLPQCRESIASRHDASSARSNTNSRANENAGDRVPGVRSDRPSRAVVDPLMMSIDVAPFLEPLWPARLQLILDNWKTFTPQERERVSAQVAMNWRKSQDRRWFASVIRSPIDELLVRYFIRFEPNAQEDLSRWLAQLRKK